MASLYTQLNQFYTSQEGLYIYNQSSVNYAIAHMPDIQPLPETTEEGIETVFSKKKHGLFTVLTSRTIHNNDTVTSTHLSGQFKAGNTALFLTNYNKALSYFGEVTLKGEVKLPSEYINPAYIDNKPSKINAPSVIFQSGRALPELSDDFTAIFKIKNVGQRSINSYTKYKNALYFNSFTSATEELRAPAILENIIMKGNFILSSADTIHIKQTAKLTDVIIMAPVITIESGFKGAIQAYATQEITIGTDVTLSNPSVICIYNQSAIEESSIKIGKQTTIAGAVIMFGFPPQSMNKNLIDIEEGGIIVGDIYCQGRLVLRSDVFGSVYTNKFLYKSGLSTYENCIANIEINSGKLPDYFVSAPLFKQSANYGIIKKLM